MTDIGILSPILQVHLFPQGYHLHSNRRWRQRQTTRARKAACPTAVASEPLDYDTSVFCAEAAGLGVGAAADRGQKLCHDLSGTNAPMPAMARKPRSIITSVCIA